MVMHLGPTEDHKEDGYFIKALRKAAANEVAHANMMKLKAAQDKRKADALAKLANEKDEKK